MERIEGRALLSITAIVSPDGTLLITADAADPVAIGSAAGSDDVQVDGANPDTGPFPSRDVTSIQVICTATAGADANVIDLGDVTPDNFTALTSVSVNGGGGDDRLIGPNVPLTWALASADAGILAGPALGQISSFTFTSIENFVAGTGDDTFIFGAGASLTGSIDGGAGVDTLDFSGISDPIFVTLTNSDADGFGGTATGLGMGFRGIDAVIGGLGTSTLAGDDASSTWDLDGNSTYNDGNATLSFSQFGNVRGGLGANTFDLIGDSLGDLAENLDGGGGDDRFVFEGDVSLAGTIDGGGGYASLDFSGFGAGVDVELTGSDADGYSGTEPAAFNGGGFQGIDSLIGHQTGIFPDTITGEDTSSTWSLGQSSSYEDSSGRPLDFSGFEDIDGGAGDDSYRLDPPAGSSLILSDAGGDDTLDFSSASFGVTIDVDSSAPQSIGPGRTLALSGTFDNIIGSPFPDAITIDGSDTPRSAEGGLPATYPGDVLTFDAGGRSVTLSSTQIVALGLAPVTYSGFESVMITNDTGLTRQASPTTSALTAAPVESQYGQPRTFTLDVAAATTGSAMPTGTVQFAIDGVPFGPAISPVQGVATSPAIADLDAGEHTISASYSGDADFAASTAPPMAVEVTKAPLTVAADDATRAYGQANPAFAASYSGFVLGQDAGDLGGALSFTTTATPASLPGDYPITPGGLTSPNYAISYADGTLTVTTIAIAIASKSDATVSLGSNIPGPIYGQPLFFTAAVTAADSSRPTPTGTVQFAVDGVPFGPAISPVQGVATSPAIADLDAGEHTISASYSGDADFAASTAPPMAVEVTKAPLTVAADDATRAYGQANPAFAASYSGFVLGQDASVLDGTIDFSTTATSASHVGNYPIIASGAISNDYSITLVPGTLSVTPALLTVSAVDVIKVYWLPVPMLTASYSGFVNGDGPSSLAIPVTLATTATKSSTTGFYPIIASGAFSPDYAIAFVNGLLAVPPSTTTASPGQVAFVNSLYRNILGRAPEFTGLDYWLERLISGTTRAEVVREFFGSAERRRLQREHKAPKVSQKAALTDAIQAQRRADRPPTAPTPLEPHENTPKPGCSRSASTAWGERRLSLPVGVVARRL